MIGFGWKNPFPLTFGGGESTKELVRNTILLRLAKILDTDSSTEHYAETAGEAALIALIWSVNKRLANQGIPARMIDNLSVWEESTGLKPAEGDSGPERRAQLEGKLRGQINNAVVDIEDVARKSLGINFVALIMVDPANRISYWPGVNPGPPGYEWSSNQAHIAIQMNKTNLTDQEFIDKRERLHVQLQRLLPSWMTFEIGTGTSFQANIGILGQAIL